MTFELLPVMLANAIEDLDGCVPHVLRGALDARQLGTACGIARRVGILSLFVDSDADRLHACLSASARMFAHGARTLPADTIVASRCTPLFDALAARDDAGAAALAAHVLTTPFRPGKERAEDNAWVRFIAFASEATPDDASMQTELRRLGAALEDNPSPRLDAGTALVARDTDAFARAVMRLAQQHADVAIMRLTKGALGEDEFASEGQLCVEGLALLALADRRGMALEVAHATLPDEARRRSTLSPGPDDWRAIGSN